ncbi:hypothetical protein IM40_02415 [Candidatus Paracaedimonas acanthamoebae]|nr:hypothetical protein IM40_02415 [Candidatus Paracaedimonas acanthamoebae]
MKQLSIDSSNSLSSFPLSYGQKGILFLEQLSPGTATFNIPLVFSLKGELNKKALIHSLKNLWERHTMLRSVISIGDEQGFILSKTDFARTFHEISFLKSGNAIEEPSVQELIHQEISKPFNLKEGPLFRCKLIELKPNLHILVITLHHIICDGWSVAILCKELAKCYNDAVLDVSSYLPDNVFQYGDYIEEQNKKIANGDYNEHLNYWESVLRDFPPSLDLPYTKYKGTSTTAKGAVAGNSIIPSELRNDFARFCHEHKVTSFTVLLSAFIVLLYRHTFQRDIIVGVPFAHRYDERIENMVGFLVNSLPIRVSLDDNMDFIKVLTLVGQNLAKAQKYIDLPFEYVLEKVSSAKNQPFYQILFLQDDALNQSLNLEKLECEVLLFHTQTVKTELSIAVNTNPSAPKIGIEYAEDLFSREIVECIYEHYLHLISEAMKHPYEPIKGLAITSINEGKKLVNNLQEASYPIYQNTYELFKESVKKFPHEVATVYSDISLTYAELSQQVDQRAQAFSERGINEGHIVAIIQQRSLEALVNLLALFKLRAVYVPIDPSVPQARLNFVLKDASVNFIVADCILRDSINPDLNIVFLSSKELSKSPASIDRTLAERDRFNSQDPAYILYTSGSTGQPKGALISHESLINCVFATRDACHIDSTHTFIAVTSLTFDVSLLDYFLPLTVGGKVVIVPQGQEKLDYEVWNIIKDHKKVAIQGTSSFWQLLFARSVSISDKLLILIAGEALKISLVRKLLPYGEIYNLYGPTEGTIYASAQYIHDESLITIGKPLANIQLYLLDETLDMVGIGVVGELYIGGVGLARGYINRPELTAERFIDNPYATEEDRQAGRNLKLYRTGDLGRYLPDGTIEFLGRTDDQVKIRGYRIELGEIESALLQEKGAKQVLVMAVEQDQQKSLVAYVVPEGELSKETLGRDLRVALEGVLPEYMVPQAFVFLESFPLSVNGKIDRSALPRPDRSDLTNTSFEVPETETERVLAEIWKDLLHLEAVGRYDNFFQIGDILSLPCR